MCSKTERTHHEQPPFPLGSAWAVEAGRQAHSRLHSSSSCCYSNDSSELRVGALVRSLRNHQLHTDRGCLAYAVTVLRLRGLAKANASLHSQGTVQNDLMGCPYSPKAREAAMWMSPGSKRYIGQRSGTPQATG